MVTKVQFRGRHYLLIGEEDGTIATEEQFRTGAMGYAYLTPEGEIMKDGEVIGARGDLHFGEVIPWPTYKMPPSLN